MRHITEGLARPCSATDLFIVKEGLQCGNCLAVSRGVGGPALADWGPLLPRCSARTSDDKPCPLDADPPYEDMLCWIHQAGVRSQEERSHHEH